VIQAQRRGVSKLLKVASIGGILVSTAGLLMKWGIDRKLRMSDYYIKAQTQLLAHPPVVELLGEPIYFGNVSLSDSNENYSTGTEAKFAVPVRGSRNRGMMYFRAIREGELNAENPESDALLPADISLRPWKIVRLEISLDNRPGERAVVPIKEIDS